MLTIFKILVFLLLQQGARVAKDVTGPDNGTAIDISTILLARPMIFTVQADEMTVEEVVNLCDTPDAPCEIRREHLNDGTLKAALVFKSLGYAERNKMMNRILPLMNRVQIEWQEQ